MRFEILCLLKGVGILLADGKRRRVIGMLKRGKIRLEAENDFNRFIPKDFAGYRWFLLLPDRCVRLWGWSIWLVLRAQKWAPKHQRQSCAPCCQQSFSTDSYFHLPLPATSHSACSVELTRQIF